MRPLHEKYRPTTWADVIGQDKAVRALLSLRDRSGGWGGRAYFITGPSGTGKTTIARLIAAELAGTWGTMELDAGELTSPGKVRELGDAMIQYGMGGGRCTILNEAHGLRRDVVRALLVELEPIPNHAAWVFTTTCDGADMLFDGTDDAGPLVSRCTPVSLTSRGLCEPFAARALEIARAEGLDGQPLERYQRLAKDCRNSLRMMLSRIEAGAMMGGAE